MCKKLIFYLILPAFLVGCSNNRNGGSQSSNANQESSVISRYIDDDEPIVEKNIKFTLTSTLQSISYSKSTSLDLCLTSGNIEQTEVELKNGYIYRESNGAKYNVFKSETFVLENDIQKYNYYYFTIPTLVTEENYQFVFEVFNKTIKFNLYYNPANFFNVYYRVNNEVINTERVHKGDCAKLNYVYENPNHLYYSSGWVGETETINSLTPITKDVYVKPKLSDAVEYLTTSSDTISYVYSIKHIFSDKVCVLQESYKNKPVGILYSWNNTTGITDLYLPESFASVGVNCFKYTENLKIHYPGSEEKWNTVISYTGGFGSGTRMVFNSSFSY